MKAHTGFMELIIIMAFIVAGVPLLLSLVRVCNNSEFNYLDDKTIYSMADTIEYVPGTNIPTNLAPIKLDYGAAQLIAILQDDYCPDDGKLVNWKLNANVPSGEYKTETAGITTYTPVNPILIPGYSTTNTLTITRGWLAKRANTFSALHNNVASSMRPNANDPFYLVWDYSSDCWMITHEFVNIFEEK